MIKSPLLRTALSAALIAFSSLTHAALIVYTNQSTFNNRLFSSGVDTFNDISIVSPTPGPLTRTAGVYGYTATATPSTPMRFFGAGTDDNPYLSTNTAQDTITFRNFIGPVNAIGGNFFDTDFTALFAPGALTLVATDSLGSVLNQTLTASSANSFLGFVSTGYIVSLAVTAVQTPGSIFWPTVDNLTLAVPEPGSHALTLAALGAFAFAAGRQRRGRAGRR